MYTNRQKVNTNVVYLGNNTAKIKSKSSKKDISIKYYPGFVAQSRRLLKKLPSGTSEQALAKYKQDNWGGVQQ